MIGWFRKKDNVLELVRENMHQSVQAMGQEVRSDIVRMDESLRKVATQVRRQGMSLEMLKESQEQKLNAVHALVAEQWAKAQGPLLTFAEAFVIHAARHQENDESLRQVAGKFFAFLELQGIEVIWDQDEPFNDARHQVCDTRWDPSQSEGVVLEVVRPGFLIRGVPRPPALVIVNKSLQPAERQGE